MRKVVFGVFVAANVLLAGALWAAQPDPKIMARGFANCCESDGPGEEFCCWGCCWFISDCDISADCMN